MRDNPVRASVSAYVEDGLDYVTIDERKLDAMAEELAEEDFGLVPWLWEPFPKGGVDMTPEETIDFFMVGNAINFQFRDPDTGDKYAYDREGETHKGAMGMWAALHDAYEADPSILTGERLAELSYDEMEELFPADGGVDLPMLEERHEALTTVGERLQEAYDVGDGGRFATLVDEAEPRLYADGDGIIDHLTGFDAFEDTTMVGGHELVFNKRAQLAVWMPLGNLEAMGEDALRVEDCDNFELAADYHMPNIGRHTGALAYDPELADAIDAGDPLVADGRAEAELRAASVAYGIALQDELGVNGAELDGVLFTTYKDAAEAENPVHRTVTVSDEGIVTYGTTDY